MQLLERRLYFIAAFGLLMMMLSIVMIANPNYWSNAIVLFSQKPYFHSFEISSRLIIGIIFVLYHQDALYPVFILVIGGLLIAVSIGLLIIGADKHKQFALWSAQKFNKVFRWAGLASLAFGLFLIYVANLG